MIHLSFPKCLAHRYSLSAGLLVIVIMAPLRSQRFVM